MVQADMLTAPAPLNTSPAHEELVSRAKRWLAGSQRCVIVASDIGAQLERPDAIGWPYSGGSIVVEVKVSRSDFLADRQKIIRRAPHLAMGAMRWYLAPKGLIAPDDLPEHWGLLEPIGAKAGLKKVAKAKRHQEWNLHAEQRLLIKINSDLRWQAQVRAETLESHGIDVPSTYGYRSVRPIEETLM